LQYKKSKGWKYDEIPGSIYSPRNGKKGRAVTVSDAPGQIGSRSRCHPEHSASGIFFNTDVRYAWEAKPFS